MTPRARRKENQALPRRWTFHHGAYYYRVPPGCEEYWDGKKMFRLGGSLGEAHKVFAERIGPTAVPEKLITIGDALDRYAREVVPTKAPKTQAENSRIIGKLRAVFGAMPLKNFKTTDAYAYQDRRGAKHPTAANRELEVLSHVFTKCKRWGLIERHPMTEGREGFEKIVTPPRDRYVEDWEVAEALSMSSRRKKGSVRMCQAYIKLKLATGFRRTDLLKLRISDMREDGIHVMPSKTASSSGRKSFRKWTPELREIVQECLTARPVDIGPFLFCNKRGESYFDEDSGSANGFDSIWQRFMGRVLTETKVRERFQERDLRAKAGTDAEDLDHAQALLDHSSKSTTRRVYRRKPEAVEPNKVGK